MPQSSRSSRRVKGPSGDISFSHSKSLKIPREQASPATWARFCSEVAVMGLASYSVAVAIGEDLNGSVSSAHQLAELLFSPHEKEMYTAWRKGKAPPRVDWRRLTTPLSATTSAQRSRWNDLTNALRELYKDSSISKENCKAWIEKYNDYMPLLNACKKVESVRHDAKAAKNATSSKSRYDVHEIMACRYIINEIGKQRVRSNTLLKKLNKEADEREADLMKRLNKVNGDEPKDRESVASKFAAREQYFAKLTKTRVERVQMAAEVNRQNLEMNSAEMVMKERIALLEDRLMRYK